MVFTQGNVEQGASAYKVAIDLTKDDFDLQKKFQYEYGKSLRVNKQFDKSLEQLHLAMETKSNLIPERFIQEEINKAKASDCS